MARPTARLVPLGALALWISLGIGCAVPRGSSGDEQRASVQKMREDTLERFYAAQPSLRERIANSVGYAVFSNVAVQVFALGAGHGYGIAHDNRTGQDTYMRMGQVEAGLGMGLKDFRAMFVFTSPALLSNFVERGWQFGGSAEGSAIAGGDAGVSAGAEGRILSRGAAGSYGGTSGVGANPASETTSMGQGVEVYQLTENGVALRAAVAGTKYWKDAALN